MATPALSRPRSSVFGRRPIASNRWEPTICELVPAFSTVTAMSSPRFATATTLLLTRMSISSSLRISATARETSSSSRDEMRSELDDRNFASEAAIGLRKFKADIAPSEHDQMRGQKIHVHHRAVGQVRDLVEPAYRRRQCARAHIDENLIGSEHVIADFHLLRPNELGVAFEDRAPFQPPQGSLDPFA